MARINLTIMIFACMLVPISIHTALGQEAVPMADSATIRGEIVDTSPEMYPIEGVTVKIINSGDGTEYTVTTNKDGYYEKRGLPAGRYTISVSKDGYGDRIGKSKVVVAGGEIFDRFKMREKENLLLISLSQVFTWQLVVGFVLGFLIALAINIGRPRV